MTVLRCVKRYTVLKSKYFPKRKVIVFAMKKKKGAVEERGRGKMVGFFSRFRLFFQWYSRPCFTDLASEFGKMTRDPGRYLVIPGDEYMRLPDYTSEIEQQMYREMDDQGSEEFVTGQDYFDPSRKFDLSQAGTMKVRPTKFQIPFELIPSNSIHTEILLEIKVETTQCSIKIDSKNKLNRISIKNDFLCHFKPEWQRRVGLKGKKLHHLIVFFNQNDFFCHSKPEW